MSMEASPHVKEDKNYMSFIQDFMFTTYYKQIICWKGIEDLKHAGLDVWKMLKQGEKLKMM